VKVVSGIVTGDDSESRRPSPGRLPSWVRLTAEQAGRAYMFESLTPGLVSCQVDQPRNIG